MKIRLVTALAASMLLLSACSAPTPGPETPGGTNVGTEDGYSGEVELVWITVNGVDVPCAIYEGPSTGEGGIDCMPELVQEETEQ